MPTLRLCADASESLRRGRPALPGAMSATNFRYQKVSGGEVAYLGSLASDKVLLFIGRSNTRKQSAPLQALLNRLMLEDYVLLWPLNRMQSTSALLVRKSERFVRWIDRAFGPGAVMANTYSKKLIKALILAFYPARWDYVFKRDKEIKKEDQIDFHRQILQSLGGAKLISILSHSAGGIIASHLGDEPNLKSVICFGYPFKHPDKQEEPERTDNLKKIQIPFLVVQGTRDAYGGAEVINRYELSPSIEFEFVGSDHDYEDIPDADWSRVIARIETLLGAAHARS